MKIYYIIFRQGEVVALKLNIYGKPDIMNLLIRKFFAVLFFYDIMYIKPTYL